MTQITFVLKIKRELCHPKSFGSFEKWGPWPELVNDILMNMDIIHVTLLVLLDVNAAFDTVDASIFFPVARSWIS